MGDRNPQHLTKYDHFANFVGVEVLEADPEKGTAKARIQMRKEHENPHGFAHGGVIYTLIDTVGGVALAAMEKKCTTLSSNIDFLNTAAGAQQLIGTATPVRIGGHVVVYDVTITDETDKLIARSSVTYYLMKDRT